MAGVAMVVIWVLIYIFSNKKNTQHTNNTPSVGADIATYWIVIGVPLLFLFAFQFQLALTLLILSLSPYLLARLPIYKGWVKTSVFLTLFACFVFHKNNYAGSLFSGYLAAKRIKSVEKRQEALTWLRDKFLDNRDRRDKLFSGEIIVYVLIDAALTHPNNNEYLAKRLSLLESLPVASIPKAIAVYCSKRALANVLPSNDWQKVMPVVSQWHKVKKTSLTSLINAFYHYYLAPEELSSFRRFRYLLTYRLTAWRHRRIKHWCVANMSVATDSANDIDVLTRTDAIHQIWKTHHNNNLSNDSVQEKIVTQLTSDKEVWESRSKELGSWDNSVVDNIYNQIQLLFQKSELSQEEYEFVNGKHDALYYIANSIENKLESKTYKNAASEMIDFLQFLSVFYELKRYESEQLIAFSRHHNMLWNWMAGLWNDQDEYRLAYMIGATCYPYAVACSYDGFVESISFVTSKENK